MERETGVEPATSSLGTYSAIGSRQHMRPRRWISTIKNQGDPGFCDLRTS